MPNSDVINEFRDQVNANLHFTLNTYKNKDGKNYWNIICACMDWIDVAIDSMKTFSFNRKGYTVNGLEIFMYISAIDIVWESVCQLHRAITNEKKIPFEGEKTIFVNDLIHKDDNVYFKHIRSVFGAHPVNLHKDKNNDKWFASWPTAGIHGEYDVSLYLYNSNPNIKDIVFGFKFEDLNKFFIDRYDHLRFLADELEKQYQNYKTQLTTEKIYISSDIKEQLDILESALNNRRNIDVDYHRRLVDKLKTIYTVTITNDLNRDRVQVYREETKKVVDELTIKIQNMDENDLLSQNIIDLSSPQEIHYELSKLYECLSGYYNQSMYLYYLERISEFLKDYVHIELHLEYDELILLINIGLYNYWSCKADEDPFR